MNIEDLSCRIDFAILFMMLHEVPDRKRLLREVYAALKPGGKLLFAEPVVHVSKDSFEKSLQMMLGIGFAMAGTPKVAICRSALLEKPA
jgi:SAM-dependent methyltransferase